MLKNKKNYTQECREMRYLKKGKKKKRETQHRAGKWVEREQAGPGRTSFTKARNHLASTLESSKRI